MNKTNINDNCTNEKYIANDISRVIDRNLRRQEVE